MGCMGQPSIEYNRKLAMGNRFEEYVYPHLYDTWGVLIESCKTYEEQCDVGENYFGIEIKYDDMSKRTTNIYIETAEKSDESKPDFSNSGIHRVDNSWLFLNGTETKFYIFLIKELRILEQTEDWITTGNPTSKGFLIPKKDADMLAWKIIVPNYKDHKKIEEQYQKALRLHRTHINAIHS